jgi:hypothetical protein
MKRRKVRGHGTGGFIWGLAKRMMMTMSGIENDDEREKKIQLRNDDSEIGEIDDDGDDGDDDEWL